MKKFKDDWITNVENLPDLYDSPQCDNCRFWTLHIDDETDIGMCRRYPPNYVVINNTPVKLATEVYCQDYCGEWRFYDPDEIRRNIERLQP